MNDRTPKPKPSHENRTADNNTTKKYLTNSDKSIYNLKWQVGNVVQENYLPRRRHSQHDKSRERSSSSSQNHSHKHRHHHHHHRQEQSELNNKSMPISNSPTSYHTSSQPVAYYYPYAYPPMPAYSVNKPQRTSKTMRESRINQNENSDNLLRNTNQLKIEHHYVNSPDEAQKLIDDLRRKGFVPTGIETPGKKK
jgi:hypothetical protein